MDSSSSEERSIKHKMPHTINNQKQPLAKIFSIARIKKRLEQYTNKDLTKVDENLLKAIFIRNEDDSSSLEVESESTQFRDMLANFGTNTI